MTHPAIEQIIAASAKDFDVKPVDVLGPRQDRATAGARHVAMWLAHQRLSLTLTEVARQFNRDRHTLLYGIAKVEQRLREESGFEGRVLRITKSLERLGAGVQQQ